MKLGERFRAFWNKDVYKRQLMDRWKDLSISMISWRLDMLCRDAPPSHFSEKIMCSDKGSFG